MQRPWRYGASATIQRLPCIIVIHICREARRDDGCSLWNHRRKERFKAHGAVSGRRRYSPTRCPLEICSSHAKMFFLSFFFFFLVITSCLDHQHVVRHVGTVQREGSEQSGDASRAYSKTLRTMTDLQIALIWTTADVWLAV